MWMVLGMLTVALVLFLAFGLWNAPFVDENENPIRGPGLSAAEFPEQTGVIAKDQPQYRPLPAFFDTGAQGEVITCWQLNWRDRLKLLFTGRLWASTLTFREPLQPLYFTVDKADVLITVAPKSSDV